MCDKLSFIVYTRSCTYKHKLNFLFETLFHNMILCIYPKVNLWNHVVVFGEIFVRRKFSSAKIPFGENTFGEKSVGEKSVCVNSFGEYSGHEVCHTYLALSSCKLSCIKFHTTSCNLCVRQKFQLNSRVSKLCALDCLWQHANLPKVFKYIFDQG